MKKISALRFGSSAPSQRPRVGMPGELLSASSIARKKGEDLKSSTSEKTSSHSPLSAAAVTGADCLSASCDTSKDISSRFSWYAGAMSVFSR